MSDTVKTLEHVDEYLHLAQEYDCSDVHLSPTCQPKWRRFGLMQPIWENGDYLTAEQTEKLARIPSQKAIETSATATIIQP